MNNTEYSFTAPSTAYGYGVTKPSYNGQSIEDVEGLTKSFVLEIINKPGPLSNVELKLLREETSYTKVELADIIGKARHSIINWENGRTGPDKANDLIIRLVYLLTINDDEAILKLLKELVE